MSRADDVLPLFDLARQWPDLREEALETFERVASVGAFSLGDELTRFEACCFDSPLSVASDAEEKVPTGGELTLFEAVGPVGLTSFCCVARCRSGMPGVT